MNSIDRQLFVVIDFELEPRYSGLHPGTIVSDVLRILSFVLLTNSEHVPLAGEKF